jgi:AcrR family transcriptional regulator
MSPSSAAGVSPGLVVHHFGSKRGLRQAVDAHVVAMLTSMLGELPNRCWRSPRTPLPHLAWAVVTDAIPLPVRAGRSHVVG